MTTEYIVTLVVTGWSLVVLALLLIFLSTCLYQIGRARGRRVEQAERRIRQAINELPGNQPIMVHLFQSGQNFKQVALALGLPVDDVISEIVNALSTLDSQERRALDQAGSPWQRALSYLRSYFRMFRLKWLLAFYTFKENLK